MWKVINKYPKYEVNENGNIRNVRTKKILKPEVCKKWGYLRVRLYVNERESKHELIHRIVAKTFITNPKNLPEVNHIDENKLNNNVKNLEWCTSKYNSRFSKGISVIMLTKEGAPIKKFYCIKQAQFETGINDSSIIRCCKNRQTVAGGYKWKYNWSEKKGVDL